MQLTSFTISSLAAELHNILADSIIVGVDPLSPAGICLRARRASRTHALCVAAHPHLFCPFLCTNPHLGQRQSPFVDSLRRLLVRHTITAIKQWQHDRIMRMELHKVDEIHGVRRRVLILELVPRRQNLILVDLANNSILLAFRRVTRRMSRVRLVGPGLPYQSPPKLTGLHPQTNTPEEFLVAIRQHPQGQLAEGLAGCVPSVSPYLLGELSLQLDLEMNSPVAKLKDTQLMSLWRALTYWAEKLSQGAILPTLVLDQRGHGQVLLPYEPRSVPHPQKRTFDSLSLALENTFADLRNRWTQEENRKAMSTGLHRALHRSRRALKRLEAELANSRRAEEFQKWGEIIAANIHQLNKGLSAARLPDPYSARGEMILVPLDPRLSPAENAQRYFKRSRKAKVGLPKIEARLEEVRSRLKKLEDLRQSLKTLSDSEKLVGIKTLLDQLGVLVPSVPGGRSAREQQPRGRPLTITLPGGWTVLVGRSNRENDRLTHQIASPRDLWFHAQGVAGGHVILRREGRKDQPSKKVLEQTASVAAYFSRARYSKTVPVVYTEKRYVRKPKGAKPGMAVLEREKTLFVEPKLARKDAQKEK